MQVCKKLASSFILLLAFAICCGFDTPQDTPQIPDGNNIIIANNLLERINGRVLHIDFDKTLAVNRFLRELTEQYSQQEAALISEYKQTYIVLDLTGGTFSAYGGSGKREPQLELKANPITGIVANSKEWAVIKVEFNDTVHEVVVGSRTTIREVSFMLDGTDVQLSFNGHKIAVFTLIEE